MIGFRQKGNFLRTERYFKNVKKAVNPHSLDTYAQRCVAALASATPVDSGLTARSWYYKINKKDGSISIAFYNSNIQNGAPIAILIQYGHGTRNGGWVEGRDYINPAVRPFFDQIANEIWREVTKS